MIFAAICALRLGKVFYGTKGGILMLFLMNLKKKNNFAGNWSKWFERNIDGLFTHIWKTDRFYHVQLRFV